MTVYAYARVSTLQQANDGDSLEAQVKQVHGYASSRGLELHEDGVFVEKGVSVHSIDLGGDVTGNGVGAIIFTILSAFATFERERIASRISEVKQLRKSQGYFVGGRRAFGFDVVEGKKVPNEAEQALIAEMKTMREAGSSLLAIHRWLTREKGIKLANSSLRSALL
jgi:DNA invertase Pin-like site-specific DNA recombinase